MSRRHFQMIAGTINRAITRERGNTTKAAEHRREAARDMAYAFTSELRRENPRFDSDRFLAACFAGTEFDRSVS